MSLFRSTALSASRLARQPLLTVSRSAVRHQSGGAPKNVGHTVDKLEGVYDNAFNRERLAVKRHAAATADFWRKLSLYVVVPALIVTAANTWVQWTEHWEHQSHEPPIDQRPQYPYMNIRTKAFPWGDGDKTLFWNDKYNYHDKSSD